MGTRGGSDEPVVRTPWGPIRMVDSLHLNSKTSDPSIPLAGVLHPAVVAASDRTSTRFWSFGREDRAQVNEDHEDRTQVNEDHEDRTQVNEDHSKAFRFFYENAHHIFTGLQVLITRRPPKASRTMPPLPPLDRPLPRQQPYTGPLISPPKTVKYGRADLLVKQFIVMLAIKFEAHPRSSYLLYILGGWFLLYLLSFFILPDAPPDAPSGGPADGHADDGPPNGGGGDGVDA